MEPIRESSTTSVVASSEAFLAVEPAVNGHSEEVAIPDNLFPLPLTALERMYFEDDHRDYPCEFTVVMEFEGEMNRNAFEEAARQVIRRNPFMSAIVNRVHSRLHWSQVKFPDDQIRWLGNSTWNGIDRFDLRKRPGFRICGRTDGQKSEVYLSFHHAVSDGRGARRCILDWGTFYAMASTPTIAIPAADRLDYGRLKNRGAIPPGKAVQGIGNQTPARTFNWESIRNIYDFLSHWPTSIRSGQQTAPQNKVRHHLLNHHFHLSDVNRFRDQIRGTRFNLNDVSVALLLNAIAKWNRSHGESGSDRLYRVMLPVDLREPADEFMPAANRMSLVFIARPTNLCLDWPRLLPTIRDEMQYIEDHDCQHYLVKALPIVQSLPGFVGIMRLFPFCYYSAVLSHLGHTVRDMRHRFKLQDGQIVVGSIRFIRAGGPPPLRPKTRLGLATSFSMRELVINCQIDSLCFSKSDAEGFLGLYVQNWLDWSANIAEFRE